MARSTERQMEGAIKTAVTDLFGTFDVLGTNHAQLIGRAIKDPAYLEEQRGVVLDLIVEQLGALKDRREILGFFSALEENRRASLPPEPQHINPESVGKRAEKIAYMEALWVSLLTGVMDEFQKSIADRLPDTPPFAHNEPHSAQTDYKGLYDFCFSHSVPRGSMSNDLGGYVAVLQGNAANSEKAAATMFMGEVVRSLHAIGVAGQSMNPRIDFPPFSQIVRKLMDNPELCPRDAFYPSGRFGILIVVLNEALASYAYAIRSPEVSPPPEGGKVFSIVDRIRERSGDVQSE